jgi:hypothetical protein
MTKSYYIQCRHCVQMILLDDDDHQCFPNYNSATEEILYCYSCGKVGQQYTNSQRNKNELARCVNCVGSNITEQYVAISRPNSIDKQLQAEVNQMEPSKNKCKDLLERGANPNYIYQRNVQIRGVWYDLYDGDFNEIPETDSLRLTPEEQHRLLNFKQTCIFSLSNCLLTNVQMANLNDILKMLIQYGAIVTQDDLDLFTRRYGTDHPVGGHFHQMYTTLVRNM